MYNSDKRIIRLIDLLLFEKKVSSLNEFHFETGLIRQTFNKIKNGTSHFTVLHIENICKKYNVNANWIYGTQPNVYNTKDSVELEVLQ